MLVTDCLQPSDPGYSDSTNKWSPSFVYVADTSNPMDPAYVFDGDADLADDYVDPGFINTPGVSEGLID